MSTFAELVCPSCNQKLISGSFEGRQLGRVECPHCHHEFDGSEGTAQQAHGTIDNQAND